VSHLQKINTLPTKKIGRYKIWDKIDAQTHKNKL